MPNSGCVLDVVVDTSGFFHHMPGRWEVVLARLPVGVDVSGPLGGECVTIS